MAQFANICELLRMRKAYAGWDTLTFGRQSYHGHSPWQSAKPVPYTGGDSGEFSTREQLMNNSHFALILFVCSSRGLLLSGDHHIR